MKNLCTLFFSFLFLGAFAQSSQELVNLGPNVNSKYVEAIPIISADGDVLFFMRQNHPENAHFDTISISQDAWYSVSDGKGGWGKAQHMSAPLNQLQNNSVYWVSPDGNRIIISGAFKNGVYAGRGISICYKTVAGWSAPEQLVIKDYGKMDLGRHSGAGIGNDGKTILTYFSEKPTEPGLVGDENTDLYVSFPEGSGAWTQPQNLGPKVNSDFAECNPFLASDGITLYFSSDRPGGLGKLDIWKTQRLDETWTNWTEPVNMGSPINSPSRQTFFSLDASGEYGYMSTYENTIGMADIVKVKLKETDKPKPVALVDGHVYNAKTKEPISAKLYYEILPSGTNSGNAFSSPVDGNYSIVLPAGKHYGYHATADGFLGINENLDLTDVKMYKEITKDLYLVPIEVGQSLQLNNVFFVQAKSELLPSSYPELDRLAKILNENPLMEIEVGGHTDNVGDPGLLLKLSEDRVKAVESYLVSKGIKENRILGKGYGGTKPLASNASEETRKRNRRVEFTIVKK